MSEPLDFNKGKKDRIAARHRETGKPYTLPAKAANDSTIQPMPEVGLDGNTVIIMATLDGNVTMRTPGGDVKLAPDMADKAVLNMREAARVARHIRALTATAPKGLDEEGMIAYLTKAFSEKPL